jgi:hypothetical protein
MIPVVVRFKQPVREKERKNESSGGGFSVDEEARRFRHSLGPRRCK